METFLGKYKVTLTLEGKNWPIFREEIEPFVKNRQNTSKFCLDSIDKWVQTFKEQVVPMLFKQFKNIGNDWKISQFISYSWQSFFSPREIKEKKEK